MRRRGRGGSLSILATMRRFWLPWILWLPVVGTAVAGCGDAGSGPPVPSDTVAPRVADLFPVPLARDVSQDAIITVTFSEPINPATVGVASFLVRRGFDTLPGTYAFGDSTASFIPAERLEPVTGYSVALSRGIRDPAGNQLDRDTVWAFQTAAVVPPAPPGR
jgi:hypothetical protein